VEDVTDRPEVAGAPYTPRLLQDGISVVAAWIAGSRPEMDCSGPTALIRSACSVVFAAANVAASLGSTAAKVWALLARSAPVAPSPVVTVAANWAPPSNVGGGVVASVAEVEVKALLSVVIAPIRAC